MAAPASSNIFNLSDRGRTARAISPVESGRMLNDCRDLAMRRLSQSLHEMLAEIEEDLFQMAEATFEKEMHDLYLEVRGKAKEKWPRIEDAFARQFVDTFNRTMRGEVGPAIQSAAVTALELTLVDEDQLAESIALQQVAGNLRESCEDELSVLGERVAVLLGKNQLKDEENPISPQAVCSGLKAACDEIDGTLKQKLVLLRQIERRVSEVLHSVYADLNTEMVRWDVLPDLKHAYRRPPNPAAAKAGASKDAAPAAAPGRAADGPNGADLFSALQHLMQARYTSVASTAQAFPLGALPARADDGAGRMSPPAAPNDWLDSLTAFQRSGVAAPAAEAGADAPLPSIFAVSGTTNVLREIKARAIEEGVGQLDAITIDIVAMLFDFIFDDAKIPDGIKALVGRLQIPVLKVAMLDKAFFSSKAHPARKLLDDISRAAISWGASVDQDDPLYKELSFIVERIQSDFERDVQVFTDAINLLAAVVAERDAHAEGIAERSAGLMRQRETEEIAWVIAGEAVSRRDSSAVPPALRQFLVQHWQHVLKELCLRYGEDHHAYLSAVATMDDLLWSVAPKENSEERKQLVGTLPGLLRALHGGLDVIRLSAESRGEFFDQLVTLHSSAVKAGLGGTPEAEQAAPATDAGVAPPEAPARTAPADQYTINPEGELLVTRITQDDVQIEEVALVGARGEAAGADIYRGWVAQLKRGDWVEFRQNDGSAARARLSWISPQRGVFLFTNPRSPRATSVSPDALAHQFRVGLAEIVVEEALFDRAVTGVLGNLQAA